MKQTGKHRPTEDDEQTTDREPRRDRRPKRTDYRQYANRDVSDILAEVTAAENED